MGQGQECGLAGSFAKLMRTRGRRQENMGNGEAGVGLSVAKMRRAEL